MWNKKTKKIVAMSTLLAPLLQNFKKYIIISSYIYGILIIADAN